MRSVVSRLTSRRLARLLRQVFVEYFALADSLMDVVEDGGFELHLYLQGNAIALQRSS